MVLERCDPGSICQAPKERPEPVLSARCKVLAFFIVAAIVVDDEREAGWSEISQDTDQGYGRRTGQDV